MILYSIIDYLRFEVYALFSSARFEFDIIVIRIYDKLVNGNSKVHTPMCYSKFRRYITWIVKSGYVAQTGPRRRQRTITTI